MTETPHLAAYQGDLFDGIGPDVDTAFSTARRIELDEHSWIEHVPGWLHASNRLFDELLAETPWDSGTGRCGHSGPSNPG